MLKKCMVRECRFNTSHTTSGHKCGKCGMDNHGIIECTNYNLKKDLDQYKDDIMPPEEQCIVFGCQFYKLHSKDAHHCYKCNKRDPHSIQECPLSSKKIKCPICRVTNEIKNNCNIIYGISDKCSICLENNINIVLPTCNHCCLCKECLDKLV